MLAFTPLTCGLMGYQPSRWALVPTHTSRGRVALSATPPSVLCVGECLFDALPSGIFLGGAPLNVACHLAELGAQASFASAVGDDRLGRDALRRLRARGVDVDLVATDATAETGFVTAEVDAAGDATYTFATHSRTLTTGKFISTLKMHADPPRHRGPAAACCLEPMLCRLQPASERCSTRST